MKLQLVYPMAFYVFYVWLIAIFMFRSRIRAVMSGEVSAKYFKSYTGQPPADRTILIGRHYDNQFQNPMLFFAACIAHMVVGAVDTATIVLAWAFIVCRLWHSWVHLGKNKIMVRVAAFASSWLVIFLMWAQLVYFAINGA